MEVAGQAPGHTYAHSVHTVCMFGVNPTFPRQVLGSQLYLCQAEQGGWSSDKTNQSP